MWDAIFHERTGALSGIFGAFALAACIAYVGYSAYFDHGPLVTPVACADALKAIVAKDGTDADVKARDAAGMVRIVGVWPAATTINRRICVAVAGVAAQPTEAQLKQNTPRPPVELALFLNGRKSSDLTFKAVATPDIQYVVYDLTIPADATSTGGKFWRDLLAGGTERGDVGVKALIVGVSRSASDNPEAAAKDPIRLRIYELPVFLLGVAAVLLLSLAFCVLAKHTTLLRDNDTKDANGVPTGPYSLGRAQMALWLVLTVAGFIFIWLTLGEFLNLITASVLVLLGINGATGLAAIQINKQEGAAAVNAWTSHGFLSDLLYDNGGPKLQRIQVAVWTVILAIIFAWNALANFTFVAFDTNLLLLMGIANTMYLGFKNA